MIIRYTWPTSSITHLEFGRNLSGNPEASIVIPASAQPEQLLKLRESLIKQGIASYLDADGDKTIVKITGHNNEESLISLLANLRLVSGSPARQALSDEGKQQGIWQKVREKGTNIAGALGMAGHAALIASGAIAHEKERVMAGLQYGTSAGILAIYGSGHEEKISKLCSGLRDHLEHEGIPLGNGTSLTPVDAYRQRNILQRSHDAFKANSILAANLIGVGGNFSMLKSGYDVAKREGVMMGVGRAAHGGINLLGAGVASFVEEKDAEQIAADKARNADKKTGIFASAKDWISRAPLAFQGSIFLVDNIATNYDAYKIRERYFQRQKTDLIPLPERPANAVEGSDAHRTWKKSVEEALHGAGHAQRLDENWKSLTAALEKIPGASAIEKELGVAAKSIPGIQDCLKKIGHIDEIVGHQDTMKAILAERKILLQELEEVQKYPRGWWLAAAKAVFWTSSSAFQAIATKNRGTTPEQKYSELAAQVATMALDVPAEQRDMMIHKSAEYLASKDFVHLKSEELAEKIQSKVKAISKSPWAAIMKGQSVNPSSPTMPLEPSPEQANSPGTVIASHQLDGRTMQDASLAIH